MFRTMNEELTKKSEDKKERKRRANVPGCDGVVGLRANSRKQDALWWLLQAAEEKGEKVVVLAHADVAA
jgi:hypothetical protein